ncbi:MAG TPA: type II toxin-antitoxin system VapC family toxin [Pyrinomonadaceae bacterium]|jgi:tRNA(fMet)-specific endonuclease VapC|nr:type II toxin-antitoxin system VapC family toxin [Pyrinomonadaceae bacterium]
MYLLDTDHLTVLERGGEESRRLLSRLENTEPDETAVTIITYEEQTRGWFAYLAKARSPEAVLKAYQLLHKHLETFCTIPVVEYDEKAAEAFRNLQGQRLLIGTMDLKIAAIAIARDATLLTRNLADFNQIHGLHAEDWTI